MSKFDEAALDSREATFFRNIEKVAGCWHWRAALDRNGYGKFSIGRTKVYAHRYAYMAFVGPIPEGMQLDHVCHSNDDGCRGGQGCMHRRCVNPDHLEAVTAKENTHRGKSPSSIAARRTHCPQGHPYDEANTIREGKSRRCRACQRARGERRSDQRRARRAATAPPAPAVGQVWQDCDPRSCGRLVRIVGIDDTHALVELHQRLGGTTPGRRTRVHLARFRPRRGYRFVASN